MTEAPERIWAVHWNTEGAVMNGAWADTIRHFGGGVEYLRADHVDALLKAEREKALREAAEVAGVKPIKGGRGVSGPHHAGLRDGRSEAKRLILALISEDATDG